VMTRFRTNIAPYEFDAPAPPTVAVGGRAHYTYRDRSSYFAAGLCCWPVAAAVDPPDMRFSGSPRPLLFRFVFCFLLVGTRTLPFLDAIPGDNEPAPTLEEALGVICCFCFLPDWECRIDCGLVPVDVTAPGDDPSFVGRLFSPFLWLVDDQQLTSRTPGDTYTHMQPLLSASPTPFLIHALYVYH